MAEILSFYSRSTTARRPHARPTAAAPGLVVLGPPTAMLDCRILPCSGNEARLDLELAGAVAGAVLIDLAAGMAHYGRIEPLSGRQAGFAIVETHDLDAPGAPQLLRRIWLDRTLTEGADCARRA